LAVCEKSTAPIVSECSITPPPRTLPGIATTSPFFVSLDNFPIFIS